jgi:hypothetical protein
MSDGDGLRGDSQNGAAPMPLSFEELLVRVQVSCSVHLTETAVAAWSPDGSRSLHDWCCGPEDPAKRRPEKCDEWWACQRLQASEAELREALEQRGALQLGRGWQRLSPELRVRAPVPR